MFTFDESISFLVACETQEEVDRYWDALCDGGEESECGWFEGPLRGLPAGRPDPVAGAAP
jgi:hypothetical protein